MPLAEDLAVEIYRVTRKLPSFERFGLASQMQRAAVSIGANIAEGCGYQGDRAFIAYLHRSVGSANELQFETRVASRLGYFEQSEFAGLIESQTNLRKGVIKLITALR
jgi:four helix bundle protein